MFPGQNTFGAGGGFGQPNTTPAFGSAAPAPANVFGNPPAAAPAGGGMFGQTPAGQPTAFGQPPAAGGFGQTSNAFGTPAPSGFGAPAAPTFGAAPQPATGMFSHRIFSLFFHYDE